MPAPRALQFDDEAPFTPEAYPELSPEACEILNTPLEKLDPEIARALFAGLARSLAEILPPELGLTDPRAVFATICERLGGSLGDVMADLPPAGEPGPAPAAPDNRVSHAPPLSPDPPGPAASAGSIEAQTALPPTPSPPSVKLPSPRPDPTDSTIAASEPARHAALLPKDCHQRSRTRRNETQIIFLYRNTSLNDSVSNRAQQPLARPLPPRRGYYAARAGPPRTPAHRETGAPTSRGNQRDHRMAAPPS